MAKRQNLIEEEYKTPELSDIIMPRPGSLGEERGLWVAPLGRIGVDTGQVVVGDPAVMKEMNPLTESEKMGNKFHPDLYRHIVQPTRHGDGLMEVYLVSLDDPNWGDGRCPQPLFLVVNLDSYFNKSDERVWRRKE